MYTVSTVNKVCVYVQGEHPSKAKRWYVIDTYAEGSAVVVDSFELPCEVQTEFALTIRPEITIKNHLGSKFGYIGDFTDQEKELIEWTWDQCREHATMDPAMNPSTEEQWTMSEPRLIMFAPFSIEK